MPGMFLLDSVEFLYHGYTDGFDMIGTYANTNTFTASHRARQGLPGHNSLSWRSRLADDETSISIGELGGSMDTDRLNQGFGVSANRGFKGRPNLSAMIKHAEVKLGMDAAKELFDDRPMICMDFGFVNPIGAIAAMGVIDEANGSYDATLMRYFMSSDSYYGGAGIDEYLNGQTEHFRNIRSEMATLSKNSLRTCSSEEYEENVADFAETRNSIWEKNDMSEFVSTRGRYTRRKQKKWANFVNDIYGMSEELCRSRYGKDSMLEKAPVLVIGDVSFGGMRGKRSAPTSWVVNYLKRFFLVVMMDEYNTSQKCPKCWGQMDFFKSGNLRLKKCDQCDAGDGTSRYNQRTGSPFVIDRDISAPMNMLGILLWVILTGERPDQFKH